MDFTLSIIYIYGIHSKHYIYVCVCVFVCVCVDFTLSIKYIYGFHSKHYISLWFSPRTCFPRCKPPAQSGIKIIKHLFFDTDGGIK